VEALRIVQVAHAYPPYQGGLSHVVDMLSRNLVEQGHEVEVVTLDPSFKLERSEEVGGVHVRRFPCLAPSNMYFMPSMEVVRYLRSVEADVLHAHNLGALLVPLCWLAVGSRREGTAFVLSPHHHAAGSRWHARMLWRPYRPIARRVVESADVVHCVSDFEAQLVRDEFGVEPVVVPNGVASDVFEYHWSPPEEELVLTYAGRLERYKRVRVLVEAAALLREGGHDVTIRIIGEGPERSNLLRASRQVDVEVEYHSFLPRPDYLGLLSKSSCFVNPSRFEAFSMVVAEALAMGLPVVASRPWGRIFGNLPNVVVVDGGSPGEVADAISKVAGIHFEGGSSIPSWHDVAQRLVREVYIPSRSGGETPREGI